MGKPSTPSTEDQRIALAGILASGVPRHLREMNADRDALQARIMDPIGTARKVARFIADGCRPRIITPPKILYTVTSDGRSYDEIIASLEAKGAKVDPFARRVIAATKEKVTKGVTYNFVGIEGTEFEDDERVTSNIRAEAEMRGYPKPTVESALLLREKYPTQAELGAPYAPVMHEAVEVVGYLNVLGLGRDGSGDWVDAWFANPESRWDAEDRFLFLLPQVIQSSAPAA